ncbi:MAG: hypothetical protein E7536_09140 [Ruminococcaceae bacterium]|nr:hypothetical protein [Oscillospiraceae bacterium]
MSDKEKDLFIENMALKNENNYLKKQNQDLRERIEELEQIPEFERIKRRTAYCGATQQTEG